MGNEEVVLIKIKVVLNGRAVDVCYKAACQAQRMAITLADEQTGRLSSN